MKGQGGEEVQLLLIHDLGTRWGEWPGSLPSRPGTHCTGGWVGPRAGLDTEDRGKILSLLPGIEPLLPGGPAHSQTLYWLRYPGSLITVTLFRNCNLILLFNRAVYKDNTGKTYSLEYTGIPKVFMLHVGRCATVIRRHCCVLCHSYTVIPGHCCL
jgi:hypothetical protein